MILNKINNRNIRMIVLLFILQINSFADVTDSLKNKLDGSKGKDRIKALIALTERIEKNQPEEALNYVNESLRLLDINPDKELETEAIYHKGWCYYYLQELDSAKSYAELTKKISLRSNYSRGLVLSNFLNARIFRTEGLYNEALKFLTDARKINEAVDDKKLEAKILNELGSVYRRQSRYDEAFENHLLALEILKDVDDEEELTLTYTYLGINSDLKGNYDDALGYYHKALELNKKDNDKRGIAGSNHNLGILYQKIGKYNEALEYYNSALKYWREIGKKDGLASTLNSIGAVNELQNNHSEALKYYKQALEIWEEMGSKYSIAIALNNIGSIYEFLENFKEAISYLQRAIDLRESIGDKNGKAGSLIVLADVYNSMGKTQTAVATIKNGIELAKEVGNLSTLREGYSVLSSVYENAGHFKESLEAYKNYKSINDSLFNSESRETFAEMQEKYKSEEHKQQIELLKKENEIQNLYRTILIAGLVLLIIIVILLYNWYRLKQKAANLRMQSVENKAAILQVQYEQKKKELDSARDLQLSMLPSKIPQHPNVDIAASMITATEVGGDFYDFHSDEDGTLTIAIGDATGHGAKAGVMVTAAKSLFSLLSSEKDIAGILNLSSAALRKMNFTNLFMALGLLRIKDNELELTGAGMPPAYVYRAGTGKVEEVMLKGLPLGSNFEINYSKAKINLSKGDIILVLSDGLPELFNNKNEMLGFEKIPFLLKEAAQKSPEGIIKHLTDTADKWLDGTKQQDDMTFIVFKVK